MFDILYEDNHLLAVVKPPGMPAQPDPSGDLSLLDAARLYIKEKYNKPGEAYLGLVHRLDRPVGGVMVFARTSKAAARLSEQFRERTTEKSYLAVTERNPVPPAGALTHYLLKLHGKNIVRALAQPAREAQEARLHYATLQTRGARALLAIELETGRRHQIRAQLAATGCPIVGDVKYGKTQFLPDKSIALLARSLQITHPVTKADMVWQAPYPASWPWNEFNPLAL